MRRSIQVVLAALALVAIPPERSARVAAPPATLHAAASPTPPPQLDRVPSASYPQFLNFSQAWGGFNVGSGGQQMLGNNNQLVYDKHGMISSMGFVNWYDTNMAISTDSFAGRSVTGFNKPKMPLPAGLPAPEVFAIGPDGCGHGVWPQSQGISDPYGEPSSGNCYLYRRLKDGVWSAPAQVTPCEAWINYSGPQLQVARNGICHIYLLGYAADPLPNSTHYGSSFMAYTNSNGDYHIVDGTQADPLYIGDAGSSGHGDVSGFQWHLMDDNTAAVIWTGWFPNDTRGRTWGIHYHRVPVGGQMLPTQASLYPGAPPGSLTTWWGGDRWASDGVNDHVFYQANYTGPMIHLVNGVQVESFNIPAGEDFGHLIATDSRGQLHVVGAGYHWIKKTDGTWVHGPFAPTMSAWVSKLIFGRNDEMILICDNGVWRQLPHNLGERDAAAHTGVMPGGSVDLVSGNFHFELPLFSTKGVGPTQAMSLHYNSMDNRTGFMSAGWRLNYEMSIGNISMPWGLAQQTTLTLPDGRIVVFNGSVPWPEYGFSGYLEMLTPSDPMNSLYRLTVKDGTQYLFGVDGKLASITDASLNRIDLNYDSDGYLVRVVDQVGNGGAGRTSWIEYASAPINFPGPVYPKRISRITDPLGTTYEMDYGSGWNLLGMTVGGVTPAPSWKFTVDSSTVSNGFVDVLKEKITQIQTPLGGWYVITYLNDNRVQQVTDPLGATKSIWYDESIAGDQPRHTQVTDRRGFVTDYTQLDSMRSLALEIRDPGYGAPGITSTMWTYDASGQLQTYQDRWGKLTTYTYQYGGVNGWALGLVASIMRPDPNGPGQLDGGAFTWTSAGVNMPIVIASTTTKATPAGATAAVSRTTTMTYGDSGAPQSPTSIKFPDVTGPGYTGTQSATKSITYGGPRKQVSVITNEEGNKTTFSQFDPICGLPCQIDQDGGTQHTTMRYDIMGNVLAVTAPHGGANNDGNTTSQTFYDGLQRPILTTDPASQITAYKYDAGSNLTQVMPPAGSPTSTTYDLLGRAISGTTPDGSWSLTLDADGNAEDSTDIRGQRSYFTYDFMGRVLTSKVPGGSLASGGGGGPAFHQASNVYDQFDGTDYSSSVTQLGAQPRVTVTVYDYRGRTKRVIAPDGLTKTETFYDEMDQVSATQQLSGTSVQTCTYMVRDARDRVGQVVTQDSAYLTTPTKISSTYTIYNKVGSVMTMVDPLGNPSAGGSAHKTAFLRDARERVTDVIDGKGTIVKHTVYGDDDLATQVSVPDPVSKSTALVPVMNYQYTGRGEVKKTIDGLNASTQVTYNQLPGEIAQVTDPLSRVTATTYDTNTRRPTQVVEAQGTADATTTQYQWTNGLPTQTTVFNPETGGLGSIFKDYFDAAGRPERKEYPAPSTGTAMAPEVYTYNEFGELSKKVIGSQTTNLAYDSLGQLTSRSWAGPRSGSETRTYTPAGLPNSVSNGIQSVSYTWNTWNGTPLDEVFNVSGQTWKIQTKQTDVAGNTTGLVDPEAQTHGWPVDENNRPSEKRYGAQGVSAISYTPGGLIDTETLKDASGNPIAKTIYQYDAMGRQTHSQTVKVATNELLSDYGYSYDTVGQVSGLAVNHLGTTFTITSDARGRLKTQVTAGNSGGTTAPPFTNILVALSQGNESTSTTDAQAKPNTRISVPARNASYVYGASGNRTSQTVDGVTTNYNYNALNQLVTESSPNKTVTHVYDDQGNEITKTTAVTGQPTVTESFGYNNLNLMSSYTNSSTGAAWQYDFWPDGSRYGKTDLTSSNGELYIPRDGDVVTDYGKVGGAAPTIKNTYVQGLGIDSKLLRIAGGTQARSYMLGDLVGSIGATIDSTASLLETNVKDAWGQLIAGSSSERYGFAQRENDTESGLVYMRHRMYDPRTGRFTQTDPLLRNRPSAHYSYGSNNPLQMTDPLGLEVWSDKRIENEVSHTNGTGMDRYLMGLGRMSAQDAWDTYKHHWELLQTPEADKIGREYIEKYKTIAYKAYLAKTNARPLNVGQAAVDAAMDEFDVRAMGALQGVGGLATTAAAVPLAMAPEPVLTKGLAVVAAAVGVDNAAAGFTTMLTGNHQSTASRLLIKGFGASDTVADYVEGGLNGLAGGVGIVSAVRIPPPASGFTPSSRPSEPAALKLGKKMHKEYDWGAGWEKEVKLPSGKQPDAINFDTFEVGELKKNNPRQIRLGRGQLEGYKKELEKLTMHPWTTRLETYDPD
jgi:RHS repeat-associated protein